MGKTSSPSGTQVILSHTAEETKYDLRLMEKKIQHGFMTKQEREQYLKALGSEADYDFTSAESLTSSDTASH